MKSAWQLQLIFVWGTDGYSYDNELKTALRYSWLQTTSRTFLHSRGRGGRLPGDSRSTVVEITTRQMRVDFGIGEQFFKLTRQLGECFFFHLSESFFAAYWVLFLPDSEIQTHTWHGDLFIIMTHTKSWWPIFRVGLVQSAHCTNQGFRLGRPFGILPKKKWNVRKNHI
jgi:hypothetical protein